MYKYMEMVHTWHALQTRPILEPSDLILMVWQMLDAIYKHPPHKIVRLESCFWRQVTSGRFNFESGLEPDNQVDNLVGQYALLSIGRSATRSE